MKDLYTFDLTEKAALHTYNNIRAAYRNLFHEISVPFLEVRASSGDMGGTLSHEFHFPSPAGEDTILACDSCSYAVNEEVINDLPKKPHKCPSCDSGTLSAHRAIEVGHTFHLGTRYSEPLNAVVTVPIERLEPDSGASPNVPDGSHPLQKDQKMVHLQMGCHGIGVSRLVGAIATMTADQKGLCWPVSIAPYHVVIVFDGRAVDPEDTRLLRHRKEGKMARMLSSLCYSSYSDLKGTLDCVVDDRDKPLPWKLKDADLVGYPIIVVLGKRWKETGEIEFQCRSRPELSRNAQNAMTAVQEILEKLSAPLHEPGWMKWYISKLSSTNESDDGSASEVSETSGLQTRPNARGPRKKVRGASRSVNLVSRPEVQTQSVGVKAAETQLQPKHEHKPSSESVDGLTKQPEGSTEWMALKERIRTKEDILQEQVQLTERLLELRAEEANLKD
jgi:hypothetical protein